MTNKKPLQPGMRVDAKIWIDRRTLIEWIFEPLFIMAGHAS
jgi:membrane fusion protein